MKIGIITYHCHHNYGAVLQALASQYAVKKIMKDADSQIINYYSFKNIPLSGRGTHLLYKPRETTPAEYIDARNKHIDEIEERYRLFTLFVNEHMNLSEPLDTFHCLAANCPPYDVYISGGDQIWNTMSYLYNKSQYPYFLAFTNSPNKIAYGCGMYPGRDNSFRLEFETVALLRQYKRIMVREEDGAAVLRRYLNQPIDVVLDPTLLLKAEDYKRLAKKPGFAVDSPYIFAYFLGTEKESLLPYLTKAAKLYNKKIIFFSDGIPINTEYITTATAAGPAEWLWLILNSDGVLSGSFHGTAFSVIFNKPLLAVFRDSRKTTLLDNLGLSGRIVGNFQELLNGHMSLETDYTSANELLEKERIRCSNLLKEAIEMCN